MRKMHFVPLVLALIKQWHPADKIHLLFRKFASHSVIVFPQIFHIRINVNSVLNVKLAVSFYADCAA